MRTCVSSAALVFVLFAATASRASVGFQQLTVPDPQGKPLAVGIWYPASGTASSQPLDLFTQQVVANGQISGNHLPLILISHGAGGSLASHYDTALALAGTGFVVAAITHTGDNYMDQSYTGNRKDLIDRPRQIKIVTDYMLSVWQHHSRLDPNRIGIFGFSLGGFTALVEIGGTPDLRRMILLCSTRPNAPECAFIKQHHGDQLDPVVKEPVWVHDSRIKAAVVAAPAVGFLFGSGGLQQVTIPVQLWRAEKDQQAPDAWNSAIVRQGLPRPPQVHVVPGDHFVFAAPCSAALAKVAAFICTDPSGFDRAAFHSTFNRAVVTFFQANVNSKRRR
jgi:predicted dienelactone hydrolase